MKAKYLPARTCHTAESKIKFSRPRQIEGLLQSGAVLALGMKMLTGIRSRAIAGLWLLCLMSLVEGSHRFASGGRITRISRPSGSKQGSISLLRLKGGDEKEQQEAVASAPVQPTPPKIEEGDGVTIVTQSFVTNKVRNLASRPSCLILMA
jgi:hypothetical protein